MQAWQKQRFSQIDGMIGNTEALAELHKVDSGFVLISGAVGTGKTSLALAYIAEKSGRRIEEHQRDICLGSYFCLHCHAADFEIGDAERAKWFFTRSTPTWICVDEAQELQLKRQQSRLKCIPLRDNLTIMLCTQDASQIEKSIQDRCVKIRLGALSAREVPDLVRRTCASLGIPYDVEITKALNRAEIFRPRAIINACEAVSRGKTPAQAVIGQDS
jgi:DNA polymerase III delta prime subunit